MLDIRLRKRILQFFNQNLHSIIFNYYARNRNLFKITIDFCQANQYKIK